MSIRLKSNESKTLEFGMEIDGTKNDPNLRFIIETENAHYMFPGRFEDDKAIIDMPKLNTIVESIDAGEYDARIEVIIDDNFYEPWSGSIDIVNPVEIKMEDVPNLKESKKKVTIAVTEGCSTKKAKKDTTTKAKKATKKKITEKKAPTKVKKASQVLTEVL